MDIRYLIRFLLLHHLSHAQNFLLICLMLPNFYTTAIHCYCLSTFFHILFLYFQNASALFFDREILFLKSLIQLFRPYQYFHFLMLLKTFLSFEILILSILHVLVFVFPPLLQSLFVFALLNIEYIYDFQ